MKPLQSAPSLVEQVHRSILSSIASGQLRHGERIIQEQLAHQLGISRQPVQQALTLLRKEGVLIDAPGRGLQVAPLDLDHVRHMYEVRAVIEGLAFRNAAERNARAAAERGPALIRAGRQAVASGSYTEMIEADMAFHDVIYSLSGNPLVAPSMQTHWTQTQRVMGEVLMRDDKPRDIWDQHETVPVDEARTAFPISATAIRNDPYRNWRYLPGPVRPYYLKRVTLVGAESTGKTTLSADLARHYDTVVAPEYGRFHTEAFGSGATSPEDMRQIVMGHLAGVAAASLRANRVLIEDTDPVLTAVWSDTLAGSRDPWFDAYRDYPDLYLFCDIDLPWVDDGTRYFHDPAVRRNFHRATERELISRGVKFVRVRGTPEQRRTIAVEAIDELLRATNVRR